MQSYVTLRVPLYVSYVFHSPVGVGGWQHFDLKSELRLTFVYDTAILWTDGIGSPPEAELQGELAETWKIKIFLTYMNDLSDILLQLKIREATFNNCTVIVHTLK